MHTQRLQPRDTAEAAEILRRGGLLGIPTETVYGLGANGLNPDAVGRIFAAKGRPQDNPLILHIPSADWLERYCADIPDTAYALAERFWPGPLTMVLRRKRVVPDVVTAGLDTVGMRCPAHPVCRAILAAAAVTVGRPAARPQMRPAAPPRRATPPAGQAPPIWRTCWRIWTEKSTASWTGDPARWGWSPPSWI